MRSLQQPRQLRKLSNGLGWFSVGLGVAELVAPDAVAWLVGVTPSNRSRKLLRVAGARELAAGVGILSNKQPKGWVWSRVAGDMMDLSMLGAAMNKNDVDRSRLNFATYAVLGVTALDILTGNGLSRQENGGASRTQGRGQRTGLRVKRSITIGRPRAEVYEFWHDFQNLPRFMKHLESVSDIGGGRSHWVARVPGGVTLEWDAQITADRPNELIAWRTVGDADVDNAGVVRFADAPGARGTEVHVDLRFDPPGGALGTLFAKLFGEVPEIQIANDLRRFKQVMEVGEPIVSDATVVDGPHPAQPLRAFRRG